MALEFNKFGIKDAASCTLFQKTSAGDKLFLYADYANVTTNEWASDTIYARAKGVNAIGWDYNKNGTLALEFEVLDKKLLAILAGDEFKDGTKNIYCREVVTLDASSGSATLKDAPIKDSVSVFEFLSDGTNGQEFAEATVSTKSITCVAGKGKKVAVYYQKEVTEAKTLTINANKFASNFHIVGDVTLKDTDGIEHLAQFDWLNAKPQSSFNITLDASAVATVTVTFDLFQDAEGNMCHYVFY